MQEEPSPRSPGLAEISFDRIENVTYENASKGGVEGPLIGGRLGLAGGGLFGSGIQSMRCSREATDPRTYLGPAHGSSSGRQREREPLGSNRRRC